MAQLGMPVGITAGSVKTKAKPTTPKRAGTPGGNATRTTPRARTPGGGQATPPTPNPLAGILDEAKAENAKLATQVAALQQYMVEADAKLKAMETRAKASRARPAQMLTRSQPGSTATG